MSARRAAATGLLVLLPVVACDADRVRPLEATTTAGAGPTAEPFSAVRTLAAVGEPARVRLPRIGVDAPVVPVAQLPDGTLDVPRRWEDVGWHAGGARPGQPGPAVLLGHVDSRAGPAVFARLGELRPDDVVEVVDAVGQVRRFIVERLERHPKSAFPTEAVYLPTLRTELRLVTCGGRFDASTGHYVDNVIAFAVATS